MKTNMLSLNNKFMKEDSGNTTQAPIPSTTDPQKGMKALSFLGMQNLMANPKLAQEVGIMNTTSDVSFKGGKFSNAAKVTTAVLGAAMAATALTSCEKDIKVCQKQTVIVDVQPVVDAIVALQAQINANDKAETERQKEMLDAMYKAIASLTEIQQAIQNQTLTIDEFKAMVYGEMEDGKFQRSEILNAIMVLQGITEEAAKNLINTILIAYQNGQITFQQAMAQIQGLLKENNSLLSSILDTLNSAIDKAQEYAKALLKQAKEINKNGKATIAQGQIMIEQNNALIQQNNIQIAQGQKLIEQVAQLNMSVQELQVVAKMIGKELSEVIQMSKDEIIAAIRANVADLQVTNQKLNEINNSINNNTITVEEAAKTIEEILSDISSDVSEIKDMLKNHFAKYDADMAEFKALIKQGNADIKAIAAYAAKISADIQNLKNDVKKIKFDIENGIDLNFDDSELKELLKKINVTQEMSKAEILAKMDEFLAKQDTMSEQLAETNNLLAKLGFVVSNDVINAINNIGDDLSGLTEINDKLKELLAAVQSLSVAFDLHAKYVTQAHGEEMDALNSIKVNVKNIAGDTQELIKLAKKAETSRANMEAYLEALLQKAKDIEAKLGKIPTVAEFDAMLTVHDENNQKYYGDLIKNSGVNPADFQNIEDLLKAIKQAIVDFQGTSNKLLADILARINAMDTTAPDYNAKLARIIELLENFKFECNCQCDCDSNQTVHEGIIDIIG